MAEFISLYSGSSGNCSVVRSGGHYLLIDMGKGVRVTTGALRELGLEAAGCGGILVTHQHSDHVKGLATFLKRHPLPVYGAGETLEALETGGMLPAGVPVYEYTPLQIKQAVTGYGQALKPQVMEATRRLLCLRETPRPDDTADALAMAICHGQAAGSTLRQRLLAAQNRRDTR